jgi:hypothetical protein
MTLFIVQLFIETLHNYKGVQRAGGGKSGVFYIRWFFDELNFHFVSYSSK